MKGRLMSKDRSRGTPSTFVIVAARGKGLHESSRSPNREKSKKSKLF